VIFGKGCRVGDRATLVGPLVLGDGCEVGPDSLLKDSTVFDGGRIGRGVRLDTCLLTEGAEVGDGLSYRCAVCSVAEEKDAPSRVALFEGDPYPAQGDGFPALRVSRPGQRFYFLFKRLLDIVVATVGLALLAPFWLLIVAAIRLDSPGRAIFRQRRCGQGGKEFWMYKFRTMVENAEQAKDGLRSSNKVDGPMFKVDDDPRVTALGGFLRASNLDETPQLWNILRGDLSFVGPRPLSLDEMHLNPQWRDIRLSVPQGLTGLWQVKSPSKDSFAEWIVYDIEYVNNFSFRQDLWIAFRTGVVTLQSLGRKLGRIFSRASVPAS
jgi:lipopolysaccharide/colanic/teichoic acid biosynthesis glycosyltransferase